MPAQHVAVTAPRLASPAPQRPTPTRSNQAHDVPNVRSYRATDHKGVVQLFVQGMMQYARLQGQDEQLWDEYIKESLADDLADIEGTYFASGGHYWVATAIETDGTEALVGMVALQGHGDVHGELRRLSVRPSHRRSGLGRQLVDHLEQWAWSHGFHRVTLSTGSEMVGAQALYDCMGYTCTHEEIWSVDPYYLQLHYEKKRIIS